MDETLILQKLDDLSNEVRTLKSEVLEELRQELKPARPSGTLFEECLAEVEDGHTKEDLAHLIRSLLMNVDMLNSLLSTVKGTMELKEEFEPIAKQAYPMAVETIAEVSENLDMAQIKPLIRNTLSNLENFNTALNMMKAGMELKDEIEPIAKQAYPMAIETIAEISENLDMAQVRPLIRNTLSNLENFNSALTMMKAGMELKEDIEPLAKLSLPVVIDFFTGISGLMRVSGTALGTVKDMQITPEQAEAMEKVIKDIDLTKANRLNIIGMVKKLNDPKVQEALGAIFAMLETFGSLLQAYKDPEKQQ
ncbi:DUF1641 domain-containing protein [Desulfopila inferna]|uniref:DUF1641 domain-containing protein n=1 Tax=Desulfopila inferna TaxID=468528 RepID=UPI0019662BC3|nr:DUF1641 domain-containing protein [Desulfopila inferna]MBM9603259.1 DUF1641 domain-containing protein [Desulfopila inferna]